MPQKNEFLPSKSVLVCYWKSLWESENSGSMGVLWGDVRVCRIFSETEMTVARIGARSLTRPLFWSIRIISV